MEKFKTIMLEQSMLKYIVKQLGLEYPDRRWIYKHKKRKFISTVELENHINSGWQPERVSL